MATLDNTTKDEGDHVEMEDASPEKGLPTPQALPDPAAERRFVRKLDRTIPPWIMLLYLLSYLDRANMGNARNIGLADDLNQGSRIYQVASASFYIGTVLLGPIGGLMLKVVKPSH